MVLVAGGVKGGPPAYLANGSMRASRLPLLAAGWGASRTPRGVRRAACGKCVLSPNIDTHPLIFMFVLSSAQNIRSLFFCLRNDRITSA